MKRAAFCLTLALMVFAFFSSPARASEIQVRIIGPDDLTALGSGIEQSIAARCIAKGVTLDDYPGLSVTILQMGDVLSFDAILSSKPPRAFHSDLRSTSEITRAIDEMIAELFTGPVEIPETTTAPAPGPGTPAKAGADIELPFIATSLALQGDSLFVSDRKTLYILKDAQAQPLWAAPGMYEIFRIYPYKDSILALTRYGSTFTSYQIVQGKISRQWNNAVIPVGNSLVSSQIKTDLSIPDWINRWTTPTTLEGEPLQLPGDRDFPTMIIGEVLSSHDGPEVITYNRFTQLETQGSGKPLWASDRNTSPLPLYVEQEKEGDIRPDRYYMMPRILTRDGDIIAINNDRGMSKIFGNILKFYGSDIVAFSPDRPDLDEKTLYHIRKYYCMDIALSDTTLIVLLIRDKNSLVQFIDL